MNYSEKEILKELDLACIGIESTNFPKGKKGDISYNFFLDLEHGYCNTAGNRIHLYADDSRWAVVLEKSGYQNRGDSVEIELNYIGNCIDYPIDKHQERSYITNTKNIILIPPKELKRIENREGPKMEQFEIISPNEKEVKIRDTKIKIEHESSKYLKKGIKLESNAKGKSLIGFEDFVRYLNETNPSLISAKEEEIKMHIPKELPKIMTLNEFNHFSVYDESIIPSQHETYQLIAKVLVTKDVGFWKPKLKANNHWSNWESGNL